MRTINAKSFLALPLLLGVFALPACGGGSGDDQAPADGGAESTQAPRGGMLSSLSDEDVACLEDQGVSLPERPEGAPSETPEGGPPEGMPEGGPPEGMPEGGPPDGERPEGIPEGMEDLQAAMSACDIELPAPPGGEGSTGQEDGS